MTDVFIRTMSNKDLIRQGFFLAVQARWAKEPIRMHVFEDMGIREARALAESKATTDPYIFSDDDVLIVGRNWLKRGLEAMYCCPRMAAASSLSLVEGENLAKCTTAQLIYPMHAVGAPMWIRRGIMVDLPEMDINSECGVIHKFVLDKGYEEGLINGLRHNHLGHGFSGNPALHWGY